MNYSTGTLEAIDRQFQRLNNYVKLPIDELKIKVIIIKLKQLIIKKLVIEKSNGKIDKF